MYPQSRNIHLATSAIGSPSLPPPVQRQNSKSFYLDTRSLYFGMLEEYAGTNGQPGAETRAAARDFLQQQLRVAEAVASDFPEHMHQLAEVLHHSHEQTAQAYRAYLRERRAGAGRRYFLNRAHALFFLRSVAPTKLVDGAWLYGLLSRWQDQRIAPLIQTYLEELGCGQAAQNHVLLYQKLLARYGCDHWKDGPDANFTQGAVQLALAGQGNDFFPEVIGFNLGYEQLPLHLLITAYELNELDIDPYYFSLHVTIDNAATGHARKALQCVIACAPRLASKEEFYRRVGNGYRLNLVGNGTLQAIQSFDLQRELVQVLEDKARTGARLHSDYCVIEGRPVSDWLQAPDSMGDLLRALQNSGWVRRGEDPRHSRFWNLLTDEQAPMFGVFTPYEQQLLHDWIMDAPHTAPAVAASPSRVRTPNRFRQGAQSQPATAAAPEGADVRQVIRHHASAALAADACADVAALFQRLGTVSTTAQALALLGGMLSPANHATPAGLAATRLYTDLFYR